MTRREDGRPSVGTRKRQESAGFGLGSRSEAVNGRPCFRSCCCPARNAGIATLTIRQLVVGRPGERCSGVCGANGTIKGSTKVPL